jgi:hypothetical protein
LRNCSRILRIAIEMLAGAGIIALKETAGASRLHMELLPSF